ncbi:BrnT family toxin [Phyllobacterium sp. BT25]|uniref:BrnT family toxin n=1 Tax=Phyllobacterium pellucidum TaxID=2740464 RepID=A0A849VU55_9HYPH|nr:BrnT family toxin [Phyllobacterium pellucidum]NTS32179.1 BrnT family toxin [Phyllobacterium pellucidum]
MKIIWDEPKRLANISKHGLDFAALSLEFFLASMIIPARAGRSKAIGRFESGMIVVVFAVLGKKALSVISMRPARIDERRLL